MPRLSRRFVSQESGSYHLMSQVVGGEPLLQEEEKKYFLKLLKQFAAGFFIRIHAYAIMCTHFHILATCMDMDARSASKEELIERYKLSHPDSIGHPQGTYDKNGNFVPDADGGIERLRRRLGSISCFMGELKQTFTCWYNNNGRKRKGHFWGQRFKSVIVSLDEAQLVCSAYIDLNPIRAGMVEMPEDYDWSSLGLRVSEEDEARKLLYPLVLKSNGSKVDGAVTGSGDDHIVSIGLSLSVLGRQEEDDFSLYREFVYKSGAVIGADFGKEVEAFHDALGISESLRHRQKNISEGLAFGSYELIASLQTQLKRKHVRPRSFMEQDKGARSWSYSTRVLRL